ncbi:hypothetical protein A5645_05590 [Mycobacterium asiaticum]|uniref:hypothetical protein n=1 Tax=Mycobacterium asiaticum TaxID=1790 RepID=UPI0007EFA525|nr:hypothetical protein [Mycobacterium asiaticum]OBK97746.1 hypothetical protein A5645_05590 [Mycobacterium asiaticum]
MTAPPVETYGSLLPVMFDAPPVNPSPQGLYQVTAWSEVTGPTRFLAGVEVRGPNFGGENASGVWGTDWCPVPPLNNPERKEGDRPGILDPFAPMTVWAYDECDLTAPSRAEVERRAAQILRLQEQTAVEHEFSNRLLTDAGTPASADDLQWAVATLEAQLAEVGVLGFIHASPHFAVYAAQAQLLIRSGTKLTTPLGHTWVFGGGYGPGLQSTIVATSQPYGWRNEPQLRTAIDQEHNIFAAVAERTVAIGYEAVIGAATVAP